MIVAVFMSSMVVICLDLCTLGTGLVKIIFKEVEKKKKKTEFHNHLIGNTH